MPRCARQRRRSGCRSTRPGSWGATPRCARRSPTGGASRPRTASGSATSERDGTWQKPSVILEVDPPDHTVTRRVLNRILSRKAMRAHARRVRTLRGRARRRARRARHVRRRTGPGVALPGHGAARRRRHARPAGATPRAVQRDVLQQPDPREPPRRRQRCRRRRRGQPRLGRDGVQSRAPRSRARFGDQIYAAVDAGEIDAATRRHAGAHLPRWRGRHDGARARQHADTARSTIRQQWEQVARAARSRPRRRSTRRCGSRRRLR